MIFLIEPPAASHSALPPLFRRHQKRERAVADERPRQKSAPDGLKVLLPKTLISYAMRIF
ncbi:hypothetical protein AU509_03375 [Lonsdalea britannica]|uniref:Uncharacterized protein n=1 Tax=Lonsdalea britannica TaxID=1082704 RepID=A0AAD0WL01_9GAMM|nr:hypothetical protein CKQ53_10315 [Lonsdalea britannica]OSM99845.1 hypothetical protein AU509_03375 [Lonsdalea britannica]OSN06143.1 hypothetical protein AU510_08215 [Lonsdalea britannica]